MKEEQNYKNHTRWFPLYHFILSPIMLINLIYWLVRLIQAPGWDNAEMLFLSVGLIILTLVARVNALRVQDRLIRLEERLRYEKVLSGELAEKAAGLRTHQIIALRFASDEELPGLVERTLNGEFEKQSDIKQEIKNWRSDHFRV